MNTSHLQYFYDTYRLGSVNQSALTNHVAPSTVSQAINILERELGYALTKKKRGTLELTEKGSQFAAQCLEVLNLVQKMKESKTGLDAQVTGSLKIATHQSFLNSYLWLAIRKYKKLYPLVDLQITTGIGSQISDMIESNRIDMAVTIDELKATGLRNSVAETIHHGNFKLVSSYKFKLPKDTSCLVTNIYKPEVEYLLQKAPWLKVESQLPSWTTIQKVISREPMFGYLPDYLLNEASASHRFKEPKFAQSLRYPYYVRTYYNYKQKNNPLLQAFVELAKG